MAHEAAKRDGEAVVDGVFWWSFMGEEDQAGLRERYLVPVEVRLLALEKKEDALVDGSKDEVPL